MADVFEHYEKSVRPDMLPPTPSAPTSEDELFHDEGDGESTGGNTIDYEKLASMVAEKLRGGASEDGTGATDTTDNQ